MGKMKVDIYCYFSADILTNVLQKCSLSSSLPNIILVQTSQFERVRVRVHAILWLKSQEHTENRENARDNSIAGGWFRTDFPQNYGPWLMSQVFSSAHRSAYSIGWHPSSVRPSSVNIFKLGSYCLLTAGLGHDTSVRQHYKSEHWAPCRNQTPSWYDWKIVENDVKPEYTHTRSLQIFR